MKSCLCLPLSIMRDVGSLPEFANATCEQFELFDYRSTVYIEIYIPCLRALHGQVNNNVVGAVYSALNMKLETR